MKKARDVRTKIERPAAVMAATRAAPILKESYGRKVRW